MENTFRPSRFLSLRATTPSPCTWEEIMQELTGERHAAATALFRALAAGEGQDAETSKRQQSQIKQNQPAFVPSVHLEGGRSSKHIKGYPGSIMVDIDGIPEEIFDETLERVRADPHSFLAYKTLSGRGIRVIAWMEGEVTEDISRTRRKHRTPACGRRGRALRSRQPQQLHQPVPLPDEPFRRAGGRSRGVGRRTVRRL